MGFHMQLCSKWLIGISAAGGFADSSVRIYDLEKMAASRGQASDEAAAGDSAVSRLWGHSGAVYGLDYSPDQQLLYTSSADGTVRLWSTELAVNLVAYRCPSTQSLAETVYVCACVCPCVCACVCARVCACVCAQSGLHA